MGYYRPSFPVAGKLPGEPETMDSPQDIKKIGVIGAGVMGVGVGQSVAQAGMEAVLVDISDEVLDHAKAEIQKNLRFQGMFQKGAAKKEDSATVLGRIRFTTSLDDLGDVDFVVENVPEKWELK